MKILFAASEAQPLIKTGGLADVAGSLPPALAARGCDIRLVLPAYPQALAQLAHTETAAHFQLADKTRVEVLQGTLPGCDVVTYLLRIGKHFSLPGNPYNGSDGLARSDNAERFAAYCRAVVEMALDRAGLDWQPDVCHCNDWQSGLVPALLSLEAKHPATVFTVHNLAYTGGFDAKTFLDLKLPQVLWSSEGLEFWGGFAFIKGGLAYADRITTVSPTYSREICTPAFGHGLDGLLRYRSAVLSGILNGIDHVAWNPETDPHLAAAYSAREPGGKALNKQALQREMGLPEQADTLLIGQIGRLADQKGMDLILGALPELLSRPLQLVVLGSGQPALEKALLTLASQHTERLAVRIGYDEALAHRIEAGSDAFLMPSRFEPCGLNQLYSLRYGAVPIVRRTGGLADTVIDALPHTLKAGVATGVVFDEASTWAVRDAVDRTLVLYAQKRGWQRLIRAGMKQDFSWQSSAGQYLELYKTLR